MVGEGPLEKNRPSPKLLGTFPIFMRDLHQFHGDLHRNTCFPVIRAPNGPSDVPSGAFSASFAPNGPSLGPLRAFSISAYPAGKVLQGITDFCLPCGQTHVPPSRSALILRTKAEGWLIFYYLSDSVILCAVGLRRKCGR